MIICLTNFFNCHMTSCSEKLENDFEKGDARPEMPTSAQDLIALVEAEGQED